VFTVTVLAATGSLGH